MQQKPTSAHECTRSNSMFDEICGWATLTAILTLVFSPVGGAVIRFFSPHAEGISWLLLFASMPAVMLLFLIAVGFWLNYLELQKNHGVTKPSNKNVAPTREDLFLRRLSIGLIVYWCATFVPGVVIESQATAQSAIPRHWQPQRDTNLTTTFTTNGLEYTLSTSQPHSRILIDILDSSGKIIGTFGVQNPEGRPQISGSAELPRHVQLRGEAATATHVPSYAVTQCRDGWFSRSFGRGTCSHHSGEWRSMNLYFR